MLPSLPAQPAGTAWPSHKWPEGPKPKSDALQRLLDYAFSDPDDIEQTHALVIVKEGRVVLERYASSMGADDTFPSWSMAKSMTQALVGLLVKDGRLDIHAPAKVSAWQSPGDPRRAITLDLLLRMSSGLQFVEDYVADNPSDVITMLFGEGKDDMALFAAQMPLEHKPGSFWSYSSGTSNIVSRMALQAAGGDFERFMRTRLFEPLGMTSATPKFDAAGTFIGSSFCFCTARDFARFGLLYLRGGVWEGRALLPPDWIDYARSPTWQQPTDQGRYGAHWWLDLVGPGSFSANGYDGQFTICVPELDLVIVRNGRTPAAKSAALKAWLKAVVDCFRA